jgi:hypothetical protein
MTQERNMRKCSGAWKRPNLLDSRCLHHQRINLLNLCYRLSRLYHRLLKHHNSRILSKLRRFHVHNIDKATTNLPSVFDKSVEKTLILACRA